jgi:hypothetical protein
MPNSAEAVPAGKILLRRYTAKLAQQQTPHSSDKYGWDHTDVFWLAKFLVWEENFTQTTQTCSFDITVVDKDDNFDLKRILK